MRTGCWRIKADPVTIGSRATPDHASAWRTDARNCAPTFGTDPNLNKTPYAIVGAFNYQSQALDDAPQLRRPSECGRQCALLSAFAAEAPSLAI
jgi:hypothetical protein